MSYEEIGSNIENTLARVDKYNGIVESGVDYTLEKVDNEINNFKDQVSFNITIIEVQSTRLTSQLTLNAQWHINRAYFHASPGLVAIVLGIIKAIGVVVKVVTTVVQSKIFKTLFSIHKILSALWPEYRDAVAKGIKSVSDFSGKIGLGADGLQHLINVVSHTTGVIGGVLGWDFDGFRGEYYKQVTKTLGLVSSNAKSISRDPVKFLENNAWNRAYEDRNRVMVKFTAVVDSVTESTEKVAEVAEQVGLITSELDKFAKSLPDFIKENIPKEILNGISNLNDDMNYKVIPNISKLTRQLEQVTNITDKYSKKITSISNKLERPGDVLLSVDDLPSYAKQNQLDAIDDVTSRKFQQEADGENLAIKEDMKQLDPIFEALSAPTPEPEFLGLEDVRPPEISGIEVEPRENWFVGDY